MNSSGHYKPYPAYKDSGVEWLGKVPKHWGTKKIKYLFKLKGGGTPSTTEEEFWDGDVPWVSAKDMKAFRITDTIDYITEEAVRESATSWVKEGSVLLVTRSGILKHTIPVAIAMSDVTINQDIKGLTPIGEVTPNYLARFIEGFQSDLLFAWRKIGATVESLEVGEIANFMLSIPPLLEQTAIAYFLDRETAKIDSLIAKKRRLIELFTEKRAAVISHVVTKGLN